MQNALITYLCTYTELFIPSFAYTRFRAYVRTTPALNRVYANEGMNNAVGILLYLLYLSICFASYSAI